MLHGFYSIFTQHTVKEQQPLAHMVSLDEIQHGHISLFSSWSIAQFRVFWCSWA